MAPRLPSKELHNTIQLFYPMMNRISALLRVDSNRRIGTNCQQNDWAGNRETDKGVTYRTLSLENRFVHFELRVDQDWLNWAVMHDATWCWISSRLKVTITLTTKPCGFTAWAWTFIRAT